MNVFERARSGYEHVSQGEEDAFVNGEKPGNGMASRPAGGLKENVATSRSRARWFTIGGLFALVLLITGFTRNTEQPISEPPEYIEPGAQFLHVLILANQKDHNVCKSLVSAASLNYPVPSILNWKKVFNDTELTDGGAQVARVNEVVDYIELINLLGNRDDDVVMVVDGFDTWFQLRPDVLIERFFDINRKANNRIVRSMGQAVMDAGHIQQRVVFGTQRTCSRSPDDPACFAVPESSLPRNAYSDPTHREKFLNAGFAMGDAKAMLRVFERAKWLMGFEKDKSTVQDAFSQLFGEQEYQRELTKQKYASPGPIDRLLQYIGLQNGKGLLAPHPTHRKYPGVPPGEADFGIGLDYESLLTSTTTGNLAWVVRNNTSEITEIRKDAKISSPNQNYLLPLDIQRSIEPFWSRNPNETLPRSLTWQDTPLLTNLHTAFVPASIQHLSPRSDNAPEHIRQAGWKKMWFQPYARSLLDEHTYEPYRSFAILQNGWSETAWWPLHQQKWRLRDHTNMKNKEWLPWKDVCDGFEEEVFGDGKGPWKPPRLEY